MVPEMNFRATVKRSSAIFARWRCEGRIGGLISDVAFRFDGLDYHSVLDPLPAESVQALLPNDAVQMSLTTSLVGDVFTLTRTAEPSASDKFTIKPKPGLTSHPPSATRSYDYGRPAKNR